MRSTTLAAICAIASPALAQPYFVPLGGLDGPSYGSSIPGVSADGSTVVGYSQHGDLTIEGFRWTEATGMTGIGWLPGEQVSFARQVSGDGAVVTGKAQDNGGTNAVAFHWTQASGMVSLGSLPGGSDNSEAWDISADGSTIVGEAYSTDGIQAFVWTEAGGMVGMGFPDGDGTSIATAVNADGTVIGGMSIHDTSGAWRIFRWTEAGGMVSIGSPLPQPHNHLWVQGMTDDGSRLVGWIVDSDGVPHSWIWDQTYGYRWFVDVMADLGEDISGWTSVLLRGVSADGSVLVGEGRDPNGTVECFVAYIDIQPPQPPHLLLAEPPVGIAQRNPGGWDHATLVWSEPIQFDASDIGIDNSTGGTVTFTATGSDTNIMRLDFDTTLEFDAYTITVADTATGTTGTPIDGDNDGNPGGDLILSLTHLCPGDHNEDGSINTLDVLAFLNDWAAGCP